MQLKSLLSILIFFVLTVSAVPTGIFIHYYFFLLFFFFFFFFFFFCFLYLINTITINYILDKRDAVAGNYIMIFTSVFYYRIYLMFFDYGYVNRNFTLVQYPNNFES